MPVDPWFLTITLGKTPGEEVFGPQQAALRNLNPPMETPNTPILTPGRFDTPANISRILRAEFFICPISPYALKKPHGI